jgi:hypothetical protein
MLAVLQDPKGDMRCQKNEAAKIAGSIQIEEKVAILHTEVQNKGVLNSGEVTKRGGRRNNKGFPNCRIHVHQRSLINVTSSNSFFKYNLRRLKSRHMV